MIRCSQGHENPEGSAFCDQCGEPLDTGNAAVSSFLDPDAPNASDDRHAAAHHSRR